jgi:hypothetical protein
MSWYSACRIWSTWLKGAVIISLSSHGVSFFAVNNFNYLRKMQTIRKYLLFTFATTDEMLKINTGLEHPT